MIAALHKRLRGRGGFSLTELLATMAIMALVGMVVAGGIPAAQNAYEGVMNAANADLVLTTTTTRLREVLSDAVPGTVTIPTEPNSAYYVSFRSEKTGRMVRILKESIDENKSIYIQESAVNPVTDEVIEEGSSEPLVSTKIGSGARDVILIVKLDELTFDSTKNTFTVKKVDVIGKDLSDSNDTGKTYVSLPREGGSGGAGDPAIKVKLLGAA